MQFARVKNKKKQTNGVPKSPPFGTGFFLASKDLFDLQSYVFPCRRYSTAVSQPRTVHARVNAYTGLLARQYLEKARPPAEHHGATLLAAKIDAALAELR
jgi:hypothetical protein